MLTTFAIIDNLRVLPVLRQSKGTCTAAAADTNATTLAEMSNGPGRGAQSSPIRKLRRAICVRALGPNENLDRQYHLPALIRHLSEQPAI